MRLTAWILEDSLRGKPLFVNLDTLTMYRDGQRVPLLPTKTKFTLSKSAADGRTSRMVFAPQAVLKG
jgi:hypothetical protein